MYCGRRIWQLSRVHARILAGRNRIQFGPTLPSRLAVSRPYTRQALNLAHKLLKPDSPIADIHKGYHALIDELNLLENKERTGTLQHPETASILSTKEMNFIIRRLVGSGRRLDMDLVVCILSDMHTFFHLDTKTVQPTVLGGLIHAGDCERLLGWCLRLPKLPGNGLVYRDNFHALLKMCGKQKDASALLHTVDSMGRSPTRPNLETARLALQAGFDADMDDESFLTLFRHFARSKLPFDPAINILIEDNCRDDPTRGRRILSLYVEAIGSFYRVAYDAFLVRERLRNTAELKGVRAAAQLLRTMQQDEGNQYLGVDWKLVQTAIFGCAQSIDELDFLSMEWKKTLNIKDWSDLIRNLCARAKTDEALIAYREAKNRGIHPDSGMVKQLVKQLCRTAGWRPPRLAGRTYGGVPSKSDIEQAYQLYQDLLQSEAIRGPEIELNTRIYESLLWALSASPLREHYDLGISLVNDMISRKAIPRNTRTAAAVIVWMMKNSKSYDEAFRIYRKLRGPLDGVGYFIVLDCFSKLELGPEPSVQYCFDMIRDMRASGVEVKPYVFAIMLRQFTKFYTSPEQRRVLAANRELHTRVLSALRGIHAFLTADVSYTQETIVWTQLMDTYQRLGCFAEAMGVWHYLCKSGQISEPGVSIILDACGFSKSEEAARQVLARLDKAGYIMDQSNWRSYVECLCRVGNIEKALRVLCIEMPAAGVDITADESTASVVRKFSRRHGLGNEVDKRIEQHLPGVWKSLMEKGDIFWDGSKQERSTRS